MVDPRAPAGPPALEVRFRGAAPGRPARVRSRPTAIPTAATAAVSSPICARRRASPVARCTPSRRSPTSLPHVTPRAAELCDWCAASRFLTPRCRSRSPSPTRRAPRPSGSPPTRPSRPCRSRRSSPRRRTWSPGTTPPSPGTRGWRTRRTTAAPPSRTSGRALRHGGRLRRAALRRGEGRGGARAAAPPRARRRPPARHRRQRGRDHAPRQLRAGPASPEDVWAADLERIAAGQQPDGGWTVDFASFSLPPSSSGAAT